MLGAGKGSAHGQSECGDAEIGKYAVHGSPCVGPDERIPQRAAELLEHGCLAGRLDQRGLLDETLVVRAGGASVPHQACEVELVDQPMAADVGRDLAPDPFTTRRIAERAGGEPLGLAATRW